MKVRGFRVEPGEIENQLLQHEKIKECVVVVKKNPGSAYPGTAAPAEGYICAYFVSEEKIEIPKLREMLSNRLPGYMIPSYFIPIDQVPLTPSGKVDEKALPERAYKEGESYAYHAPRGGIEKKLAEIWRDVLGTTDYLDIGIDDNFFERGGHSLKAAALAGKIHK